MRFSDVLSGMMRTQSEIRIIRKERDIAEARQRAIQAQQREARRHLLATIYAEDDKASSH
jgi:hypothetical protein